MELDSNNKIVNVTSTTDSCVPFSDVAVIAKRWMIDFTFLSLCKFFKEQNFKEFNQFCDVIYLYFVQDITFDRDERLTPLMSAVGVWASLNETVADDTLFRHVSNLLYVQVIPTYIQFNFSQSNSVYNFTMINWYFPPGALQNLTIKLSMIVSKRDTYHPFLRNFSWPRLLEKIHTFLDTFLDKHPSDFLFQVRNRRIRSQTSPASPQNTAKSEDSLDSSKRLAVIPLCVRGPSVWLLFPCVSGAPLSGCYSLVCQGPLCLAKWSWDLDRALKAGVKQHGEGRWSRILLGHDFQGRTGVQLKDRWRTLKRTGQVDAD
uniref:HTH myb-type domain-containing protein n=1 Tax=Esox lucius TaxID=8010 RepID=A0A3P8XSK1_ESOLU